MQAPPIGAQMPQLSLQQYSPRPQTFGPHGSPGPRQYSLVHPEPSGAQRLQLSLQQYSPGPHVASLQGVLAQRSSEHAIPCGTQSPPQFGQQAVPSMHSIAAQGFSTIGTQTPEQSRPPAFGSQPSPATSTHS
jgi:hypothetical protein